jgi:hypothetical protein
MTKIQCNCGNTIEINVPETYDTAEHPGLFGEICSGTFMSVRCEDCKALLKPEIPARIRDEQYGIDLLYRPENERLPFLSGNLDLPPAERVVFGYPELVEKIIIFTNGLDDRIIEIIKYFYIKKGGPGSDLSVFLDTAAENGLRFRIHGLRNDEIGIADIGNDFYEKIEKDFQEIMKKEDLHEILAPPYVSISKGYIGED